MIVILARSCNALVTLSMPHVKKARTEEPKAAEKTEAKADAPPAEEPKAEEKTAMHKSRMEHALETDPQFLEDLAAGKPYKLCKKKLASRLRAQDAQQATPAAIANTHSDRSRCWDRPSHEAEYGPRKDGAFP